MWRKRPFQLLEVLVAMALLLVCVVPILQSQVALYQNERAAIADHQVEEIAKFAASDLLLRLFRREIPWEEVTSGESYPLATFFDGETFAPELPQIPYEGSYAFSIENDKERATYLACTMTFTPTAGGKPRLFTFRTCVQHTEEEKDVA